MRPPTQPASGRRRWWRGACIAIAALMLALAGFLSGRRDAEPSRLDQRLQVIPLDEILSDPWIRNFVPEELRSRECRSALRALDLGCMDGDSPDPVKPWPH
jgi:hypothetical protein